MASERVTAYPALDVIGADLDRVLAIVDDYSPTAVEEHDGSFTIYFTSPDERDDARSALVRELPDARHSPREVDDEDWAKRSQAGLPAVTVGRLTVSPPWLVHATAATVSPLTVAIAPSMGFGTGHHATTRLCLRALQTMDLSHRTMLDVGTGSGVLALAARLLGAGEATGFDSDVDAVRSARENLAMNPSIDHVRFEFADLATVPSARADVVTANLTGTLLVRHANRLLTMVVPGGTLIVSGLMADERAAVVEAFAGAGGPAAAFVNWTDEEDGWVGLAFNVPVHPVV